MSTPLIPRSRLFGNPARTQPRISPDGNWISWLAPDAGVLNVWVAPRGELAAARVLTQDRKRGIRMQLWAHNARTILYAQDEGGNEDWHIYAIDVASGAIRDLTPIKGVNAQFTGASREHPDHIVVGLNDRDPSWHDWWRIDITTGDKALLLENTHELSGCVVDRQLVPRVATRARAEGGAVVFRVETGGTLTEIRTIGGEDELTTGPMRFTRDGGTLYWNSSVGRDKSALVAMDWASGAEREIASHPKADIGDVLVDPVTGVVQAAAADHVRTEWIVLDPAIGADLAHLAKALPGEVEVADRTADDRTWVVAVHDADKPMTYHLYDRGAGTVTPLMETRPDLASYRLARTQGVVIAARDGLELVSYLTLPATESGARPKAPLPMVLLVHGGPWHRDTYGFGTFLQWLANRGAAVLQVNFRGSTGFGKSFITAGDKEWGRKMHDDLVDAVEWAVREGVARRDKVAILGGSYGGYAALAGATFTPDVFCCAVDIVGPSNLETLLATIPPYWKSFYEVFARRVGDPRTEEGRQLLRERSPLHHVDRITKPLLIGQGANDPRVKQPESDQIVAAMRAKGLPVTYVLFPSEGHGFAKPENNTAFNAITEVFLARHLGIASEPIGDDLAGAELQVPEGADHIDGLPAALAAMPKT